MVPCLLLREHLRVDLLQLLLLLLLELLLLLLVVLLLGGASVVVAAAVLGVRRGVRRRNVGAERTLAATDDLSRRRVVRGVGLLEGGGGVRCGWCWEVVKAVVDEVAGGKYHLAAVVGVG